MLSTCLGTYMVNGYGVVDQNDRALIVSWLCVLHSTSLLVCQRVWRRGITAPAKGTQPPTRLGARLHKPYWLYVTELLLAPVDKCNAD